MIASPTHRLTSKHNKKSTFDSWLTWDALQGRTNCGTTPKCSISYRKPKGVSISYTTSNDHVENWISGGFFVREKWTTLNDYTCSAEAGETVCIWFNVAHTAYTVWNDYLDTCDGLARHSDPFILFSPNQANSGGGEYCVIGPCRHEGDWWWDYSGPAGGPEENLPTSK